MQFQYIFEYDRIFLNQEAIYYISQADAYLNTALHDIFQQLHKNLYLIHLANKHPLHSKYKNASIHFHKFPMTNSYWLI